VRRNTEDGLNRAAGLEEADAFFDLAGDFALVAALDRALLFGQLALQGAGAAVLAVDGIIDALDEVVLQLGLGIEFVGDAGGALGSFLGVFPGQGVLLGGQAVAEGVLRGDCFRF
jgi:hypothetical protein